MRFRWRYRSTVCFAAAPWPIWWKQHNSGRVSAIQLPHQSGADTQCDRRWNAMQSGAKRLPQAELKTGNTWPLSFAQEGLWLLHELAPENSAYNICRLLRLQGELNVDALHWSLKQIVARHETLR